MKKILLIIAVAISLQTVGQNDNRDFLNIRKRLTLNGYYVTHIKNDTFNWNVSGSRYLPTAKSVHDFVAGRLSGFSGTGAWGGITGTITSQADLMAQFLLKLNISDTGAMMTNYRHWLAGYAKNSDTASMLANYRHWIAGYLKGTDTASMLTNYRHWAAGYLKTSDTASMLNNYRHWLAGYLSSVATPTLDQVLNAGAVLTANRTIDVDQYDMLWTTTNPFGRIMFRGSYSEGIYIQEGDVSLFGWNYETTGAYLGVRSSGIEMKLANINNDANWIVTRVGNSPTQDRLLGQRSANGNIGYLTIGYGLQLASGVARIDSATLFPTIRSMIAAGSSSSPGYDTTIATTPLKVKPGITKDTLYMPKVSLVDSGWVSPEQHDLWNSKQAGSANLTTYSGITPSANIQSLLGAANYAAIKALLDLELGADIQAYNADLAAIAALSPSNGDMLQRYSGAWQNRTMTQIKTDLNLTKTDVGLSNVDNTSDATKNSASATLTNKTIAYGNNTITGLPGEWIIACSDETTAITTGTAKVTFRVPYSVTVTAVRASVNTASSSGIPTVDINEAGVSILSTKLTIDAGEKTSVTAATAAVLSDTSLANDAEMTIDIDVAGTGAKGLKVIIYFTRN